MKFNGTVWDFPSTLNMKYAAHSHKNQQLFFFFYIYIIVADNAKLSF